MIYHTPTCLYNGSKKWGIQSDKDFVNSCLQRLNSENQKIACEKYDAVYNEHASQGEWNLARDNANKMLADFVSQHGMPLKTFQSKGASNDDKAWIESRVEQLKKAQKTAKPHIKFKERRRA